MGGLVSRDGLPSRVFELGASELTDMAAFNAGDTFLFMETSRLISAGLKRCVG